MITQLLSDLMAIFLENNYYLIGIFPTDLEDAKPYEVKIKAFDYTIHIYFTVNEKKQVIVMGRNEDGIQTK